LFSLIQLHPQRKVFVGVVKEEIFYLLSLLVQTHG
jgi:hypothetical protein